MFPSGRRKNLACDVQAGIPPDESSEYRLYAVGQEGKLPTKQARLFLAFL
jgi:hypothetical protein